jgi:VanZ family protein
MALRVQPPLRFLAPLALMGVIFWFSAQIYDGHELAWWEPTARTLGHFLGFGLLALSWSWALGPVTRQWLPAAVTLSVAYAIGDEYHQSFVEGRSSSWEDVAIDSLGIAVAVAACRWWTMRRGRSGGLATAEAG